MNSTRKLGKLTFPEFNSYLLFNRRNWIWHLWVFQVFRLHSYMIPYFWIQVRVNNFEIILSVYRYKEWLSNYYHEIFSQWPLLLIFKTNRLYWADYELPGVIQNCQVSNFGILQSFCKWEIDYFRLSNMTIFDLNWPFFDQNWPYLAICNPNWPFQISL